MGNAMNAPKKSWVQTLFTQNPMMAEVTRFRKRFLSFRGSSVAVNGGIGIVLVCYALFAIICVYYRGDIPPILLIGGFMVLMFFAIPLMLHASIAGERERRSWDMLLVAPITHGQIIVGKFMGAFAGLAMAFGLFLIPVLIDATFMTKVQLDDILLASIVVFAQGASLIAMTILISARVRRPLIALGVTIAIVLLYFFFLPAFSNAFNSFTGSFINSLLSPIDVMSRIGMEHAYDYGSSGERFSAASMDRMTLVIGHLIFQLIVTATMLAWATKTLIFADNEVKFIPKSKTNARSKKPA